MPLPPIIEDFQEEKEDPLNVPVMIGKEAIEEKIVWNSVLDERTQSDSDWDRYMR